MATAAQAIKQVASVTGLLPATVFRAARWLREADTSMWPQGTQGRGKAAHVEPRHLTNLILALGAAEPITEAPLIVPKWRSMPSQDSIGWGISNSLTVNRQLRGCCFGQANIELDRYRETLFPGLPKVLDENNQWSGKGDPRCYQVLPGRTLGEALDSLINYLAGDWSELLREALQRVGWRLFLQSNEFARVTFWEEGFVFNSQFHQPGIALEAPDYVRSVSFSFGVIEALADLWDDTIRVRDCTPVRVIRGEALGKRRQTKKFPSQPDTPNSTPENETAAIHPLQGTDAAALSDQPARTEPDRHQQPYPTGEREISQSSSDAQAGRSLKQRSENYYAREADGHRHDDGGGRMGSADFCSP